MTIIVTPKPMLMTEDGLRLDREVIERALDCAREEYGRAASMFDKRMSPGMAEDYTQMIMALDVVRRALGLDPFHDDPEEGAVLAKYGYAPITGDTWPEDVKLLTVEQLTKMCDDLAARGDHETLKSEAQRYATGLSEPYSSCIDLALYHRGAAVRPGTTAKDVAHHEGLSAMYLKKYAGLLEVRKAERTIHLSALEQAYQFAEGRDCAIRSGKLVVTPEEARAHADAVEEARSALSLARDAYIADYGSID